MRRKARVSWDPDKRMLAVVKYRQQGESLRKIADRLGVHHSTIAADLARWEQQNVDRLLSDLAVGYDAEASRIRQPDPTGRKPGPMDRRMQ